MVNDKMNIILFIFAIFLWKQNKSLSHSSNKARKKSDLVIFFLFVVNEHGGEIDIYPGDSCEIKQPVEKNRYIENV